jgi:hypothetical protein
VVGSVLFAAFATVVGCGSGSVVGEAPLATDQKGVTAIAADEFYIYWTMSNGFVRRVSLDGGEVETIAEGKAGSPRLALDATDVYFVQGDGTISRVPKKGGEVIDITQAVDVTSIALDDTHVYFAAGDSLFTISKEASIDVTADTLASQAPQAHSLALLGTIIFATKIGDNAVIRQVDYDGESVDDILVATPEALYARAGRLAWTEAGGVSAFVAELDGSNMREIARVEPETEEGEPVTVGDVVNDDAYVYFTTSTGTVRVAPHLGADGSPDESTAEILVDGPSGNVKLAIDQAHVYVANPTDGAIFALHRR